MSIDELGDKLRYPTILAYDKDMDELYVTVNGKVIVYNSNFLPTVSLGPGRGADNTRGITLDNEGMIYLCQGRTETQEGRMTIFNPAFFPEKQISFDAIPDVENFHPRDVVVGLTDNIYLLGHGNRGLLVLDKEGEFSHWLKPEDKIWDVAALKEAQRVREQKALEMTDSIKMVKDEKKGEEETQRDSDHRKPERTEYVKMIFEGIESEEEALDVIDYLPQELLPANDEILFEEKKLSVAPVKITDVTRDSEGHLYILSEETSKVYVYSPSEEFLFSFGEKGGSLGKMSRPKSIVVDEKKRAVYIVDYMRHTILIFDMSGKFLYEFGGMGNGPGWFQYPIALTLTRDGLLAVRDLFNHRVQVLDVQFEYKFPLFKSMGDENPQIQGDIESNQLTSPDSGSGEEGDVFQPAPL